VFRVPEMTQLEIGIDDPQLTTGQLPDISNLSARPSRYSFLRSKTALFGVTAISAIGAEMMVAPGIATADCVTTQSNGSTSTTCNTSESCTTTTQNGETTSTECSSSNKPAPTEPTSSFPSPAEETPTPPAPAPRKPKPKPKPHHVAKPERVPRRFVDYNQNHNGFRWGERIAHTGCGPTVLAMIVATETGKRQVTPLTITRQITPKWYAIGSGTSERAFSATAKRYHLKERHANDFGDAARVAKLGGLSIIHARPGHFTGAGHYMVLKSYKNGKFRIADPNNAPGRDSEKRAWTPTQLRAAGIDNIWTFRI